MSDSLYLISWHVVCWVYISRNVVKTAISKRRIKFVLII